MSMMIIFTEHYLMIMSISTFHETLKVFHLTFRLNWNSLFPEKLVFFIEFAKLTLTVAWSTVLVLKLIGVLMVSAIFIKVLFELGVILLVILAVSNVRLWVPRWIYHPWWLSRTESLSWTFVRAVVWHVLLLKVMLCHRWILSKWSGLTRILLELVLALHI